MVRVRITTRLAGLLGLAAMLSMTAVHAALPNFDFTASSGSEGWVAQHDIASLTPTAEGLRVQINGSDPYLAGPARDYPADTPLWLRIKLKSEQGGMGQVFYFKDGTVPNEGDSVRFTVPPGQWFEAKVRISPMGPGYRLRIDPPGSGQVCTLGTLRFEPRLTLSAPAWPKPTIPDLGPDNPSLKSGDLKLIHGRRGLGEFEVQVAGRRVACGNNRALIGYVEKGQVRWLPFGYGTNATVTVQHQPVTQLADSLIGGSLRAKAVFSDVDGGQWEIEQTFSVSRAGTLEVSSRVLVDRARDILYLPMLTLLPGLGSYGTNKSQALFAGVEYLENEPSSSAADLNPPASNRQVPDMLKPTFPLMVVAADGDYVGLAWNRDQPNLCAVFDTPDRLFASGAQVMGLLFPGSDGMNREESSLIPYDTVRIEANRSVTAVALLLGGRGKTVIPAVQQFVSIFGLPPVPDIGMEPKEYYALAAHGWLDSKIRDGDRYRHAADVNFGSMPSADAALYMDWLAAKVDDAALAARLTEAARAALAQVRPPNYNSAQVGHERYPLPALIYGAAAENADVSLRHGRALLGRFQPDGTVLYPKPATGPDYGRTHWAREANGLAAQVVEVLLGEALFSGDRGLRESGLRNLRALDKFRDTVPRGAQTWEIPLHTPDILASAHLVKAYAIGYELTHDPELLEQARYWAWTGVPFTYLTPPTRQPVGVYSTIAVLGATGWVAPNWIGLPVQWCGLVYADALRRLATHDPKGPWKQIADGIAVAGIHHTYPASDSAYRGLLPDSYNLAPQTRNGPAINPATVLAPAVPMLGHLPLYDFAALSRQRLLVHAPGGITDVEERTDGVKFTVRGWSTKPYQILLNGCAQPPGVRINGRDAALVAPHQYQADAGRLILQLQGTAVVEVNGSFQ